MTVVDQAADATRPRSRTGVGSAGKPNPTESPRRPPRVFPGSFELPDRKHATPPSVFTTPAASDWNFSGDEPPVINTDIANTRSTRTAMYIRPPLLSERQRQFCDVVEALTRTRGFAPTVRETARAMGLTVGRVHDLAKTTAAKGCLERVPRAARSWRVIRPSTTR